MTARPVSYPCFSSQAVADGNMLLHLATGCNMQCRYCFENRDASGRHSLERTGCVVMTVESAVGMVDCRIDAGMQPAGVQIGGPGEPLLHASTYLVLRQLHELYPDLPLAVWTNGLLLQERLEELVRSGLRQVTLSLSALTPDTAMLVYDWIVYCGKRYAGREAADLVLQRQWNGLSDAVEGGLGVTAYIGRIPGVNDHEVPAIERQAVEMGSEKVIVVTLAL